MSATDKSPPHAAHQHRDMGKRVGVEERLERGAGKERDVLKGIKERNMEGQTDNRAFFFICVIIRGKPVQLTEIK